MDHRGSVRSLSGQEQHHQGHHGHHHEEERRRHGGRDSRLTNSRSVIFGSDTINTEIHEEFRQRAKRNESFKLALGSPKLARRGSMADSLRRSMEDIHDGFVSLSGTSSRAGSLRRSRSGSVASLRGIKIFFVELVKFVFLNNQKYF